MRRPLLIPGASPGLFLAFRRGIPVALALAALIGAILVPHARLPFLVLAIACLVELWPTFKQGRRYQRDRVSIVRHEGLWVKALRPLARLLGRETDWVLSFCAWNNLQVGRLFEAERARKALVLLPHCIQLASCKAEILTDLTNCRTCGLCPVGDVLENALAERWDVRIANRSHKAYRQAREFAPDLMVAVSCTDRLLKGLLKIPDVPSLAIPLGLPHGMCVDTTFSPSLMVAAMEAYVEPKPEPKSEASSSNIQPLHREDIA